MACEENKNLTSGTLVIGLGRFGSAVAATLDKLGYEILVVERGPVRVRAFAGRFPLVEADATSMDTLEQSGAQKFRAVVVGTGSSSGSSVFITANLVDLGMPSIWTKTILREHGRILRRVGVRHVIYPEFNAGQRTAHLVGGRMVDYIGMEKGSSAITKLCPPRGVHGLALEDLDLRGRYEVNTLGILRPDQPFEYAKAQTRINPEDITIVSGDARLLEYSVNRL